MASTAKKSPKPRPKKAKPVSAPTADNVTVATPGHGYAIGSRVSHPMFGDGAVKDVDGDKLTIRFSDGRMKLIVAAYVKHRTEETN